MDEWIWQNLPGWKKTGVLGKGANGMVYRAVDREFGTATAAVKVISIPQSPEQVQMRLHMGASEQALWDEYTAMKDGCVNEIKTMMALRSSLYVVHIEDYAVLKKRDSIGYYILMRMELCEPLDMHIKRTPMDEKAVIRLGIDLCRALEACQSARTVHRDIKPANIFYHADGVFKLGDFGIARTLEKGEAGTTKGLGTAAYVAPEVLRGVYDARADQYGLGLVLYTLMNHNALPFQTAEGSESAIYRRITGEKLPAPMQASRGFAAVILKACAFEPAHRYPSAVELRMALEGLLTKPAEKPKKAWWKPVLAVAAAVLVGAVLLIAFRPKAPEEKETTRASEQTVTPQAPEQTKELKLGEQRKAKLDASGAHQYEFTAPRDGKYTVTVDNQDVGCRVYFYAERNGGSVFAGWAKNAQQESRSFRAKQGDVLYITVEPYYGQPDGTYILEITGEEYE